MKRIISLILAAIIFLSLPMPVRAADTFAYTHEAGGCTISVPEGWKVVMEDEFVEFDHGSGSSASLLYSADDIWSSMSVSQQESIARKDLNNAYFSKADIADIFEVKTSDVSRVNLGGNEYFQVETQESKGFFLFKKKIDVVNLVMLRDGWMHIFIFRGDSDDDIFRQFESLAAGASFNGGNSSSVPSPSGGTVPSATVPAPTQPAKQTVDSTYKQAVNDYESGLYYAAQEAFESLGTYKDSSKYLRLIRIRQAGTNCGAGGAVYVSSCGLTKSDMDDINAAAEDFYFADTAQVLLCNTDVAGYYLLGRWEGGSKCYIEMMTDKVGGYSYYIGSKLSTNYSGTFSIIDGVLSVDILGSNALVMSMTLTSPDCMEVCSYEKGNSYTLIRK